MSSFGKILSLSLLATFSFFHANLAAQTRSQVYGSELDRQTMTAYVQGDVGMMTVESGTVDSKESQQLQSWAFGVYAGEERKLGISFHSSENRIPFSLNDSLMKSNWRDIKLQARFGWIYPNISASLSEIEIEQNGESYIDVYGPSVGAGLGVYIPMWSRAVVFVDATNYTTPRATDRNGHEVELGDRLEAEFGASIDITQNILDLLVGYRYRSYTLKVDEGEEKDELQQGAFVGVRLGAYF